MSNIFEFIDYQIVIATLMVIFALLLFNGSMIKAKRFTISNTMKVFMALVSIMPFVVSYSLSRDAQFNINAMQTNKTLICKNSDTSNYQVSKANGWKVEKNYFIKNSLMIRADQCEVQG